jgi:hypothetical protein
MIKLLLGNQIGALMGGADDTQGADPGDGGGDDPGTSGDGGESGDDPSDGGQGEEISYPDGFDETLKGNATLEKFLNEDKKSFNYANLMKSHVHLQGLLGKDKISIPDENTTPEQMRELFTKLGLPEEDKYKLENKLPEGYEANQELYDGFKKAAYELNILPDQAQGIMDFFNDQVVKQYDAQSDQARHQYESDKKKLQDEWGGDYERNLKIADVGLEEFASDEEIKLLEQTGITNNPVFTKIFNKVGQALNKEGSFHDDVQKKFGMSKQEIQDEIHSMFKPGHPYMNKMHPGNKAAHEKMQKLQELLVGKGVDTPLHISL